MPTNSIDVPEQKPSIVMKIVRWIALIGAGLIGLIGARLFGVHFWIPFGSILLVGALLKWFDVPPKLVPALSIPVGHTIWIVIGVILMTAMSSADLERQLYTAAELVVVCLIVWWILTKRSALSFCALIALELFGFVTAYLTLEDNLPKAAGLALVMHMILRAVGAGAAIYALAVRKNLGDE